MSKAAHIPPNAEGVEHVSPGQRPGIAVRECKSALQGRHNGVIVSP